MAALTTQVVPHAGSTPTLTSGLGGTSGNTAPCGAGLALMLVNVGGTAVNAFVRVASTSTVDGLVVVTPSGAGGPARQVALAASANSITFIPLPASVYADPTTGLATFDVAAGTVSGAVVAFTS